MFSIISLRSIAGNCRYIALVTLWSLQQTKLALEVLCLFRTWFSQTLSSESACKASPCRLCITELKFGKGWLLLAVGESSKSRGRNKSDWPLFDRVGDSGVSAISDLCQRNSIVWDLSWDEVLVVASDKSDEIVAAHISASDATDVEGPCMSRSSVRIVIWTASERLLGWTVNMFTESHSSPWFSVRKMSDVGHCDVLFSSPNRYFGSVCTGSLSSVRNWVFLSAMAFFLK